MNDKLIKTEESTEVIKANDLMRPRFGSNLSNKRRQAQDKLSEINPQDCPHRLGIEFDDSGSMGGQAIKDAQSAVSNFLASCNALETSVCIYPMNKGAKPLSNDYSLINLFIQGINATGGTPLYTVLMKMLQEASLTRVIIFSDGSPTDTTSNPYSLEDDRSVSIKDDAINLAIKQKTPIDTVFIGLKNSPSFNEMSYIAEKTGGIFVHFTDSASLNKSLKYLSPAMRGMLMNPEIKARIEKGETI